MRYEQKIARMQQPKIIKKVTYSSRPANPINWGKAFSNLQGAVRGTQKAVKFATKGYTGTAKEAYEQQAARASARIEEMNYAQKLRELKEVERLRAKGRRAVQVYRVKQAGRVVVGAGQKVKQVGSGIRRTFTGSIYK